MLDRHRQGQARLTSARAESKAPRTSLRRSSTAHLRSRGEHHVSLRSSGAVTGTPPLAQRALEPLDRHRPLDRLTSARAESTAADVGASCAATAHLRSRGEHRLKPQIRPFAAGSPPLARRAPGGVVRPWPARRLTSARAESTAATPQTAPPRSAYLRARGELRTLPRFTILDVIPLLSVRAEFDRRYSRRQLTPSGSHIFARTVTPLSVHYSGGRVIVTPA